jgi:hypothetical protein
MAQTNGCAEALTNDVVHAVPEELATNAARMQRIVDIDIAFGKDVQTSHNAPDLQI